MDSIRFNNYFRIQRRRTNIFYTIFIIINDYLSKISNTCYIGRNSYVIFSHIIYKVPC